MPTFDILRIAGIVLIFAMPYMAGYTISTVLNIRETGQIAKTETYLIGFFFLFLLQGIVFLTGERALGASFDELCTALNVVMAVIPVLFIVMLAVNIIIRLRSEKTERYRQKLKRDEWIMLAVMVIFFVLIIVRIFSIEDYIRDDYMLPSVRTIVRTGLMNVYNPITHRPYELGLIASRRIITLPAYYAYLCSMTGLAEIDMLYLVLTIQTVFCAFLSCLNFMLPIIKIRERIYMYMVFLGAVVLSGDYYNMAIGGRLLWNGYAGDTITAAVMLPYVLYLTVTGCRERRISVSGIVRLLIVMAASVFMTGLATGILMIVIVMGVALICAAIVKNKGDGSDRTAMIVEE